MLASSYSAAISAMVEHLHDPINTLDILGAQTRSQLKLWEPSDMVPEPSVLELIWGNKAPTAIAVDSGATQTTYNQLRAASSDLSRRIAELGVEISSKVGLYFSPDATQFFIAVLATLHMGATIVPFEPSQSQDKLEQALSNTTLDVILASNQHASELLSIDVQVVLVDLPGSSNGTVIEETNVVTMSSNPGTAACILLAELDTAGRWVSQTISYSELSYRTRLIRISMDMKQQTRLLCHGQHTLQSTLLAQLAVLTMGGCAALPASSGRLPAYNTIFAASYQELSDLRPTTSLFEQEPQPTPSIYVNVRAKDAAPSDIKTSKWSHDIKHLCLLNTHENRGPWMAHEFCPVSSRWLVVKHPEAVYEIVDIDDPRKRVPIGVVGRLKLIRPDSKFVLSSNLARWTPEGKLVYLGSLDRIVTVSGQRVALQDIEHEIRSHVPSNTHVVVEVIHATSSRPKIAVFAEKPLKQAKVTESDISLETKSQVQYLSGKLQGLAEPDHYFAVRSFPLTDAGAIDREKLRALELAAVASESESKLKRRETSQGTLTPLEISMQKLWASVLSLDLADLGLEDDFFGLGGDSISVMKLVGLGRRAGLNFSVADVFKRPTVKELASIAVAKTPDETYSPYSLTNQNIVAAIKASFRYSNNKEGKIVDVLPATGFQSQVLRRALNTPRQAFNYIFLDLGKNIDTAEVSEACNKAVHHLPILRTRFFEVDRAYHQVMFDTPKMRLNVIDAAGDMEQACNQAAAVSAAGPWVGEELYTAFGLIRSSNGSSRLMIRLSHAQHDGISLPIIMQTIMAACQGLDLSSHSTMAPYIRQVQLKKGDNIRYWEEILKGSRLSTLGLYSSPRPATRVSAQQTIPAPILSGGFTTATLLASAWAFVLGAVIGSDDVVLARVVAGRNSSASGIQNCVGPCVNTVFARVRLGQGVPVSEVLAQIHNQYVNMGDADLLPWDEVIRSSTDWAADTEIESVVEHSTLNDEFSVGAADNEGSVSFYAPEIIPEKIMVGSFPTSTGELLVSIVGSSEMLSQQAAEALVETLALIMQSMTERLDEPAQEMLKAVALEELKKRLGKV